MEAHPPLTGKTLLVSEIFPPQTGGSGRWFWEIYRRMPRTEFMIAAGEHVRQEDFDRTHDLPLVRVPLSMKAWGLCSLVGLRGYSRALSWLGCLIRTEGVAMIHCARCLPEGMMALVLK